MEHEKFYPLQPGQRTVMDPADAVEPTGAQEQGHQPRTLRNILSSQGELIVFGTQIKRFSSESYLCLCVCLHAYFHALIRFVCLSYPKFMRRVCAGRPGGTVSRERKVQWTSLAW